MRMNLVKLIGALAVVALVLVLSNSAGAGPANQAYPPPIAATATPIPAVTVTPPVSLVQVKVGNWRAPTEGEVDVSFNVMRERQVCNFRHETYPCGAGPLIHGGCAAIQADGRFNLIVGDGLHRGTFVSPTEVKGTWLFISPRCVEQGRWGAKFAEE